MKNLNTIYVVISFLANTKDDVAFAIPLLKELYGDIVVEIPYSVIRKAAKKAIKRINGHTLKDQDKEAMEAHFLDKMGIELPTDGFTCQFGDRVYVFKEEDGRWHFDHLVNVEK